ncbi:EndoU domain-containing protein [Kitasatospora sp. NPDC004723]|uniref:EndoU domain-containing protein n=1 Tax=Kitasatospora sp. NPDC004723 TaxID=3154288 RepID=UPI00339E0D78
MAHSSIEVNESTARFFTIITGMPWPEIKEGDLREVRDAYEQLHKELPELRALIEKVAIACARQFKGQAATTFAYQMNAFIGRSGTGGKAGEDYVSAAAKTAKALADCAGDVANAVEYTKWMAIAQLVQLLVEIALAIFWAPFSFGTSLSGLVLKKLLTKVALTALMKYLLKTIAMHTFSGIVGGLLMDGIIQNLQIGQGNRKEIDKEYTKQAVLFGVIGGVLGGPLDLLGLGLGKLLGRLLGKSGGRLIADQLADYLVDGELKSLKGTLKTAAEAAAASGEKGALGTIGKETSKGLADEALKKAQATAFARDLGSLMEASAEQLQAGFGKTGKGTLGATFVKEMEKTFVKHLGEQLGKKEAAALGRELGEKFAEKWVGKAQQSVLSRGAASEGLKEALGDVLAQERNAGKALTEHQIAALGKHLPDLADGLTQGNKMFQLGLALGNYIQSGTQNVLSEGFYNLIFGENHEFTVTAGSFVGGMMTAMMGHVLHLGTSPLMHGYADLVQRTQFQAVKEGAGKHFPLYHPISFAALASMASGKIVPFPVPRMGHPEAFEFAKSFRIDSLEDVAKGLSHVSGVDIKTPPADHEVAEWMQQLLPYVDFLAEERGGDHLSLAETLTRTVGGSTDTLVPADHETSSGAPKKGGAKAGDGIAPATPAKVESEGTAAAAPKPRPQDSEQKAPDQKPPERRPAEAPGQEAPRKSTPGRQRPTPPVPTESGGDGLGAPRNRGDSTTTTTVTHATATATATAHAGGDRGRPAPVTTTSGDHTVPQPDPKPPVAPRPPAGADDAGRHVVQEPAPRTPRQTGSIASVLLGRDTPVVHPADETVTPPRTPDDEVLPQAPPGSDTPVPPPAAATTTAPANAAAPLARHNAWQPTETDGTLKGGPRRPPALQDGERQETLPNGTVRVFKAQLDPSVESGAPLAAFPSRWSRSLLDPGTVYYPKGWTEAHLAARVDEALGSTQLVRVENGVTFKLGYVDGVWIEGMYLADGSLMGHRPSPYQSVRDPRYDVGTAATVGRGAEVQLAGFGPVSVHRDLMSDGTEVVRLTARVRPRGTENLSQPDFTRAQIELHRAAGRLLAGHQDGTTRVELGLRFTRDDDATEVHYVPGQGFALQQAVPRLHEAVTATGLDEVLAAVRQQAPPQTVSGETMLHGVRALFTADAWDRPTEGRHLPREWTADEARYAASVVARFAARVPVGPVPDGGTAAPTLRHGAFAGVKLTVRVEDGRITDFWAQPDQRLPEQLTKPAPEQHRVLATREVVPPTDPFERSLEERWLQRFSVSRVRLADGDTESLVTVKVYLDTGDLDMAKRATKDGLKDLAKNARAGMAEIYDLGQRLPSGDRLRVKLAFVRTPGEAHHTVQVHPTQPRPNALNWGLDTPAKAVVHEVGHLLGLPDEYRELSRPGRVRAVHDDGGMMGATTRDRFGRTKLDTDNPPGTENHEDPRPVLKARNLRQLGAVIDTAFGADRGPAPGGTHPPRPQVNEDARRGALYGTGRDGGGHLFPPPGSDRPRPERIAGSENRNGTFRVLDGRAPEATTVHHRLAGDLALGPAGRPVDRGRTMFPEHWSSDDAVYAAEQAYQHARRQKTPAFTELRPGSWTFTGEYGGVRIEGRVEVRTEQRPDGPVEVSEIVSFRPADDQGGLGPAPHLPWHPFPDAFGQRVVDLVRYGDRQTLTGFHHQPDLGGPQEGGFTKVERAGARAGVRIGNRSFHSNPNGTYRATAWFLDPFVAPRAHLAQFPSRWFRRADHPSTMFYPSHWRAGRIQDAVQTAYATRNQADDRVVNGAVHWTGTGDGVTIEGITRDGRHVIHRPADTQPGGRVRGNSAPLTEPVAPGAGRRPAVVADLTTITVPPGEVGPLRTEAGRGLPEEWTAGERLYAAYAGRPLGNETALDDGGSQVRVKFAGVEITVVRDWSRRIVDFTVADGHVPPPQRAVPIPERGAGRSAHRTGETEVLPHFPGSDEGSGSDGSQNGRLRSDEDEDMDLYSDADESMSSTDSLDLMLSSDDEDMGWEDGSEDGSGSRSGDQDTQSELLMDLDEAPAGPRPAHEAPAPDLRFAMVLDPVEITAPTDPALHSSTSTHHRRFQAARGFLLDGTPAVEAVVRIHLDTSQLPAGQDHTEALGNLRERARRSVDEYYNTGHRLPDGDVLVVRVEFVEDPARAHHEVRVLDGDVREHNDLWGLDSEGPVLGHEIGHLFGLPDEYRERRLHEEVPDQDGNPVPVSYEVRPRPVHTDAGLMAGTLAAQDRARVDMDAGVTPDGTPMHFALTPRNLRELGAAIEQALGPVQTLPNTHELPRRAAFDLDARQSSLFGDTRNPGGHLLPPAGSDRTAPERVVRVERNGVVVADFSASPAVPRARQVDTLSAAGDLLTTAPVHRRMFPRNWTGDDAVYAAEQAYLNALAHDTVVPLDGGRHRWTGEYNGVRIEGEVHGDRFLSFRPADRQPDVDPPLSAPHRPAPDDPGRGSGSFGQRAEDIVRYGDRQNLTGLHHELDPGHVADPANTLRAHGVRVVETTPPIHNGTYRARVAFLDPTVAPNSPLAELPTRWRFRGNADGGSGRTMYPRHWRAEELLTRVDEAHDGVPPEQRVYLEDGRTYYWVGEADGVRIEGLARDGAHLAHRPTDTQPMTEWDQRRVLRTSPDTVTWMGDRPLAVSRVLFDSGQEGLRITVPVRTVAEGRLTPRQLAFAENAIQSRVNDYVQQRVLETADANGLPPRLIAVVLDFAPGRPDVFSEAVVRPDAVSGATDVLGPLAVQAGEHVFHGITDALNDFTTPLADLVAQQGAPRVPADLREPGPLRPDERPPAVLAGWDQQTALQLRRLDERFTPEALAVDPRHLPVEHSLPREWTARDARWAAVQLLDAHDARHGATVTDVVRGSFGGVELAVHVVDGRIVLVSGVGDQRDLPQLHVPPIAVDTAPSPAITPAPAAPHLTPPDGHPLLDAVADAAPELVGALLAHHGLPPGTGRPEALRLMAAEAAGYLQRTRPEDLPAEVLTAFRPGLASHPATAQELRALRHALAASDGTHDAGLGDALAPVLAHALHVRLEVTDQQGNTTHHGPDSETVVRIADEGAERHDTASHDTASHDTDMLSERESSPAGTDHGEDLTMLVDPAETELAQVTAAREVRAPLDLFRRSVSASYLRGYEVRRGFLENGDPATEIVVRIHIRREPAEEGIEEGYGYDAPVEQFTDEQIGQVIDRVWEGVNQAYNTGHRLPNGDVLRVRPEFVDHSADVNHHVHIVDLFSRRLHEDNETWSLESTPDTLAHELGHLLGLDDEYRRHQNRHTVYTDAGMMGSDRVEHGRISADQLAGIGPQRVDAVPTLAPRNLRELGAAIDEVFGTQPSRLPSTHLAPDGRPLPPRASFDLDARQSSLYGDRRTEGGHLLPPAGSDRRRPSALVEQHPNGVLHVEYEAAPPGPRRSADVRTSSAAGDLLTTDTAQRRRLFPRNWTEDDAVYAAEQAYLDALRHNAVVPAGGGRHRWTGEYAGVRIEGELHGDRFLSFRPSDTQPEPAGPPAPTAPPTRPRRTATPWDGLSDLDPLPPRDPDLDYAPARPDSLLRYGQRAQDVSRYGDRQSLTGLHQEFAPRSTVDLATWHRLRGVEVIERGAPHVNGTYRARVRFLDATVAPDAPLSEFRNHWFEPQGSSVRTMFPREWGRTGVLQAVESAHASAFHRVRIDERTYRWIGEADGVRIEGISRDGRHLAYRPTDLQPGAHTEAWDQQQVIATGATRQIAAGTGRLIVRRVLFNSGQHGVDIAVPLHVSPQEGVTEQQVRAFTDRVNQDVQQAWAQGNRGRQPLLVNVTVVPVAEPAGAFRSLTAQEAAGSTVSTLVGQLLPGFGWNRPGGALRQLFDLAGPVTSYSDRVLPTTGPAALREPGPRQPGEQLPPVVPQFDVRTLRPHFTESAWNDPRGPGLPREWAADDVRYAAGVVLDRAGRTGQLPADGVLHGTAGGVTVHVRREGGRIAEVWGEPGQEGSRQHSTPADNGAPGGRNAVRPEEEPAGAPMLRALVEDDPRLLTGLLGADEAARLAADPAGAERALRELVEQRFRENPELGREAYELYAAWAGRLGEEVADWPVFVEDLHREIAAWREQGWDSVRDPRAVRDAFAVLTAAALDLRVTLVDVRNDRTTVSEFGPANGRRITLDHTEQEGYSTVAAAEHRQEQQRLDRLRREQAERESERLEAERLEAERRESERLEAERLEAERRESERLEAERLEVQRRESERLEAEERERLRRRDEEDSSEEEPTEEERQRLQEKTAGKRKAPRPAGDGEDVREHPVRDKRASTTRVSDEDMPEILRQIKEMENAESGKQGQGSGTRAPLVRSEEENTGPVTKGGDDTELVVKPKEESEIQEIPAPPKGEDVVLPVLPKAEERAPLLPPRAVTESGMLSGSHMVTSLGEPNSVLVGNLAARIGEVLPPETVNRQALARTLAESLFSDSGLRAQVSALSRGEVLHIPVGTDARHGTVTVRGEVADLVHRAKEKAKAKFEYEGGSDRIVTLGTTRGGRKRLGLGLQGRFDFFKLFRIQGSGGVQGDLMSWEGLTTRARFFSRSKTTEVTEMFDGRLLLEVGYQPTGRRGTEDLSRRLDPTAGNVLATPVQVGIPQRETRASAGDADPGHQAWPENFAEGHRTQARLHLSHVMLDVHAKGLPRLRPAPGEDAGGSVELQELNTPPGRPVQRQVMAGVVDLLARHADVRAAFKGDAATLSDRLVAEFGYQRLQQDFKGMTNGESVVLRIPGSDLRIEVKAASRELNLLALTKETEFNTGAGSVTTRLKRKVLSGLWQLQGGGRLGVDDRNVGGAYGIRKGSDSIHISGRTLETAVTTKTKEPGAMLDGDGYLEVVVHDGDRQLGDVVEVPVGFRTLMPQSDLATPPAVPPGTTPRTDAQARPASEHELTGTLLPESTVVRDLGSVGELRADLERAGKNYYGRLWPDVRDEVMQLVTQPALASRLSAMTRGEGFELNSFDQSKPGVLKDAALGRNLKVTIRATLTDSEFVRQSNNADLSRQNETSTFSSERRQSGKHKVKQGGVTFPVADNPPYGNTGLGLQERARVGSRDSAADKLYGNSKIRDAQNVHRGTVRFTVTLEGRGASHEVVGDVGTEFSVRSPKAAAVTETRTVLPRNELGASSVVSFKELEDGRSGGGQLLSEVRDALQKRFVVRGGVTRELERTLAEELGPKTLQANLSQLTRGGVLKVPVGGPGWSAEVLVRARLNDAPLLRREVNDAEIEVGTQNRTGHGVSYDERERTTGTVGLTGKPGTDGKTTLTVDYSYRRDSATGIALETAGSVVNRAKNVSRAAVSDADAVFEVEIRGWTGGLIPSTTKLGPITMKTEVVTPQYGTVEAPRAVPDRIWQTHLLGSSDVITNVFVPDGARTGPKPLDFGKAVLRGAGDPGEFGGRNLVKWLDGLGRSDLRHKLYDVLTPNTLHDQLKAMMSGRELVVSDGGVTIRIGASVRRLAHTGTTTTTEFNTGTQTEHTHSAADGATGGGTGSGHQLRATVGVSGGPWYAGGSLTGSTGHDTQETWSNRAGSGNTTKVKPKNASIFTGLADLHFRVEWKEPIGTEPPFVMATKHAYFRRPVGMETVIDIAETRTQAPAGNTPNAGNVFDSATAPRGAALRALADHGPGSGVVRIPPDRVWTHGLVDTDVVRAVGMGPDARRQLTEGAEEFLGPDTWDRVRGMVNRMIDPVALASRLSTPLTPLAPLTPVSPVTPATPATRPEGAGQAPKAGEPTLLNGPGNSTLLIGPTDLAGDVRVEVRVKIKQLDFLRTDAESESNPTNTTAVTDGVNAQRTVQLAGRVTGGAKGDLHEFVGGRGGGYLDGAYQHRTDLATGEGGQLVNNAKIKTDTARYQGFAEVEVTYHRGEQKLARKELMAIEIDIPVDSVKGDTEVPSGGYLRFHDDARDGELRLHGAPETAVVTVADALGLDPDVPADRARILGVGHAARELLAGSLTVGGDRAVRWLRGLDRLLHLAEDESSGGAFDHLRRVLDGRPVPAEDRRRLQELAEHVGEDLDLSAADVNARWDAPGPHQPVDLSLHEPAAGEDPTIRLAVDAHSAGDMNRLLADVRRQLLQAEGDGPRRVEIVLEVSAERAGRETDRLERRLREVLRTSPHEVEVVIQATAAPVARAEGSEPVHSSGGIRRFRVGPPSRDAGEDLPVGTRPVEIPPVQTPPVRRVPVKNEPEEQHTTTEQAGPPKQVPPQVRTVEDVPTSERWQISEDETTTSESLSSRNGLSDDTPDLLQETDGWLPGIGPSLRAPRRRPVLPVEESSVTVAEDLSGEHPQEVSYESWVTAPSYRGGYDSELLEVPEVLHPHDASGVSWWTARLYDGEEEEFHRFPGPRPGDDSDNDSVDSDLLGPPDPELNRKPLPDVPETPESTENPENLENDIFAALTPTGSGSGSEQDG